MKTALRTLEAYLAMVGTVLSVAILSTMQWWLDGLAVAFGLLGYFLLYKFVRGIEERNVRVYASR